MELVRLVGRQVFAVLIGACLGLYGAVEFVVHSKVPSWVWLVATLLIATIISLRVGYQALSVRDATITADSQANDGKIVFLGGKHIHVYPSSSTSGLEKDQMTD